MATIKYDLPLLDRVKTRKKLAQNDLDSFGGKENLPGQIMIKKGT